MSDSQFNYSAVIVDLGSGVIKAGFSGEDGPRSIFSSVVGTPKMPGLLVGMELRERYIGDEAINKLEIMNFANPIRQGEITDWDKFENLMHHLLYNELKIVPEELSILITEPPLNPRETRAKLAETLFETFNIERIHIANSGMLGLYSYGKTSGLVLDSGYGLTSCVPVYEGYPLPHASLKIKLAGENISEILLNMIGSQVGKGFKGIKGTLLADDIKEKLGYVAINAEEEEKHYYEDDSKLRDYKLPDGNTIKIGTELFKHSECLFRSETDDIFSVSQIINEVIARCDDEIKMDIQENICLTGGTSLLRGFPERLRNELLQNMINNQFNLNYSQERQFSNWIGGSIVSSLNNFAYMWVSKQEYDEIGNALEAVDSKCF